MLTTLNEAEAKAFRKPDRQYLADSNRRVYGWLETKTKVVFGRNELEPDVDAPKALKPSACAEAVPVCGEPAAINAQEGQGDIDEEVADGLLNVDFQQRERFPQLPDKAVMAHWMAAACERPAEIAVRFVDEDEGRLLNETYRHRQSATNVITWDYTHEPVVTADIALCVPVLVREAKAQNKTFEEHLAHLLVHGVLHAHGYDHLNEAEAEIMEARETEVITGLGFEPPYSDAEGRVHD